jgi:hypothetical protein
MARKNEIAWRKGAAFSVLNEKPFGWWELVAVHLVGRGDHIPAMAEPAVKP